ncbi:MAG: hypothetical protein Q4G43_06215, partial [Mobilicoccus sp.]|nr:hypothetical protein [Mobilicoccus sp.]
MRSTRLLVPVVTVLALLGCTAPAPGDPGSTHAGEQEQVEQEESPTPHPKTHPTPQPLPHGGDNQ